MIESVLDAIMTTAIATAAFLVGHGMGRAAEAEDTCDRLEDHIHGIRKATCVLETLDRATADPDLTVDQMTLLYRIRHEVHNAVTAVDEEPQE